MGPRTHREFAAAYRKLQRERARAERSFDYTTWQACEANLRALDLEYRSFCESRERRVGRRGSGGF